MRLVITENITLDGVIEATGWFEPAGDEAQADKSDVEADIREQMGRQDALLLGRATFESFREYWPNQTDDTTGITDHLNQVAKYVVSSTLTVPGWDNTTVLSGALTDEIHAIKARPGNDLGVTGSISLVQDLIAADLVDEYRLFVYPVVVGEGRRLFVEGMSADLQLVNATSFRSGVVLVTYQPR